MDELDKVVGEILDANADTIARKEAIEARMPVELRFCIQCGKDLADADEAIGDDILDDEYIVMVDITPEKVGDITYVCGECCNSSELPDPDEERESA